MKSFKIKEYDYVTVNGIEGEFVVVEIDGKSAYVENVSGEGACMLLWVHLDACEKIIEFGEQNV